MDWSLMNLSIFVGRGTDRQTVVKVEGAGDQSALATLEMAE